MKAKVALAQIAPEMCDVPANLEKMRQTLSGTDAEIVVFPEMFTTGYMCRDEHFRLAEGMDSRTVSEIREMAADSGKHIITGIGIKENRRLYNSALYVPPDGDVQRYDKMFLPTFGPFEEKIYFTAGKEPVMVETPFGRIGLIICYDLFFPELARYYALNGADILVVLSASPSVTRKFFENIMVSRAIENTVFLLYANLVGTELNLTFWGGDTVVGPRGDIKNKGSYFEEDIVEGVLDMEELETARRLRPSVVDARDDLLERLRK